MGDRTTRMGQRGWHPGTAKRPGGGADTRGYRVGSRLPTQDVVQSGTNRASRSAFSLLLSSITVIYVTLTFYITDQGNYLGGGFVAHHQRP